MAPSPWPRDWSSALLLIIGSRLSTADDGVVPTTTTTVTTTTTTNEVFCYKFYERSDVNWTECPNSCPYRTVCRGESPKQFTCIKDRSLRRKFRNEEQTRPECEWLLPNGQLLSNNDSKECWSCDIPGCHKCALNVNGSIYCETCWERYTESAGKCTWDEPRLQTLFYGVLLLLGVLALWVIIDILRAALKPVTNEDAMFRGLKNRRRSQFARHKWSTNLFSRKQKNVAGPGLVLFMNWLLYAIVISAWLGGCAKILGPTSVEEADNVDLCRQLHVDSGQALVFRSPEGDQPYLTWSLWNYFGASLISAAFLMWQAYIWAEMVHDGQSPRLQDYCIELSGVPPDLISKREIRRLLGEWMERLHLDTARSTPLLARSTGAPAIRYVSVAYDVDVRSSARQDGQATRSIVQDQRSRDALINELIEKNLRGEDHAHAPSVHGEDAGPFWIRLAAFILFKTPLHLQACPIVRDESQGARSAEAQLVALPVSGCENSQQRPWDFLKELKGSGYVYVVMDTKALAAGLADMGTVRLPVQTSYKFDGKMVDCDEDGIVRVVRGNTSADTESIKAGDKILKVNDDRFSQEILNNVETSGGAYSLTVVRDTVVKVRRATVAPQGIRWLSYSPVTCPDMVFKVALATCVLLTTLILWLIFFAMYLSFEVVFEENMSFAKTFLGAGVIGMLVPIGNAMFGAVIDHVTEFIGFRNAEIMRLWILILNVLINAAANFGEVVLVYTKVYDSDHGSDSFNILDLPWEFWNVFKPLEPNPRIAIFHEELVAILFPIGLLAPVVAVPSLLIVLPYIVGRLRVKRDKSLTADDVDRVLKPIDVDFNSPYMDIIINMTLITYLCWISPGRYHSTLWLASFLWAFLLLLSHQYFILQWQSSPHLDGWATHTCVSALLSIPLGILCASMEVQIWPNRSGLIGFWAHLLAHYFFVRHTLKYLFPARMSTDWTNITYDEVMARYDSQLADYLNTNPIEVLKSQYFAEERDPGYGETPGYKHLVFYRSDKCFLHFPSQVSHTFKGEMGIDYDEMGNVTNVSLNSQAHGKLITKKYQIVKVDTEKFSPENVCKAEKSGAEYEVTFKRHRNSDLDEKLQNKIGPKLEEWLERIRQSRSS